MYDTYLLTYLLTTVFSIILERTRVMDTGRKSVWDSAVMTFGTGQMYAAFHWFGTIDVAIERLKRRVSGLQKNGAPTRRNHDGG